jgi:hypothetical protein
MPVWPAQPPESTAYPFNRDERARLTIYRAAVAAGFYTDAFLTDTSRRAPVTALLAGNVSSTVRN